MTMTLATNPFHDLWITEYLTPQGFVHLFSPALAEDSEMLFSSSNVVIKGRQGSGKSMLLSLLETRTRMAYAREGVPYPGRGAVRPFISAGVNLTRENVRLVVARVDEAEEGDKRRLAAATFSDYVNYLLAIDLLDNIIKLHDEQKKDGVLLDEIRVDLSVGNQKECVKRLKDSDCWYGYLSDCQDLFEVLARCRARIIAYTKYFNYNGDLDSSISSTMTEMGQPTAMLAECLRDSGVLPTDASVFLRLDQHEELYVLERLSGYGDVFRQVINRALAMRDPRVAYRIGTRHYAWDDRTSVWGSGASLENLRDYHTLDIDHYFRRPESKAVLWKFPRFAEDVFRRRLEAAGMNLNGVAAGRSIEYVFGTTPLPSERARRYAATSPVRLRLEPGWHETWKSLLEMLWRGDPLSARLGEAFLRQRTQVREGIGQRPAPEDGLPWEHPSKKWWRKERLEVAAMQIAGDCNQSLIWGGSRQILELAGWNILPFMTICKTVWGAWLRNSEESSDPVQVAPRIALAEQTVGILEASKIWFDKLQEGVYGDRRKRLISNLGAWFSVSLRSDRALSYPGSNGFSLLREAMEVDSEIVSIIRECRDQGDLLQSDHTTKLSDARSRLKWYLNPILAPFFRITQNRTKEPIYTNIDEITAIYASKPVAVDGGRSILTQRDLFE